MLYYGSPQDRLAIAEASDEAWAGYAAEVCAAAAERSEPQPGTAQDS